MVAIGNRWALSWWPAFSCLCMSSVKGEKGLVGEEMMEEGGVNGKGGLYCA